MTGPADRMRRYRAQLVCSWVLLAQPLPSPGPAAAGAIAKRAIRTAMRMRMARLSGFVTRRTVGRETASDEGEVVHNSASIAVATRAVPPCALRAAGEGGRSGRAT
jgi:hypothetical protein